jgi:hypothetical protein
MSFPKKGKSLPRSTASIQGARYQSENLTNFARAMSLALNQAFKGSRSKVKTVAKLTGANERTVKNWFCGTYGPSGPYLIMLVRHSDEILNVFLSLAGRDLLLESQEFDELAGRLIGLLSQRVHMNGSPPGG